MTKEIRYNSLYMDIARRCAEMSYARRLKVGAVAVKDGRIISMGWNGTVAGADNNCEYELEDGTLKTKDSVIHCEENLLSKIAKSHESSEGSVVYITHQPCMNCSKLLYNAGIVKVYYAEEYRDSSGVEFLKECGVLVEQFA